jgi:hypothetical protein
VAQDPRVIEHRRGVLATVTRLQADPVQIIQITVPVPANTGSRHMPNLARSVIFAGRAHGELDLAAPEQAGKALMRVERTLDPVVNSVQ